MTIRTKPLPFTWQGQPRLASFIATIDDSQQGVYYLACDPGFDNQGNWQGMRLSERGSGREATWEVELDSNDWPRPGHLRGRATWRDGARA
jgi:hypothetical protein